MGKVYIRLRTLDISDSHLLGEMLETVSNKEVFSERVYDDSNEIEMIYYSVEYDDDSIEEISNFETTLEMLHLHKYEPIDGFDDISPLSFVISVSDDSDSVGKNAARVLDENNQEYCNIHFGVIKGIMESELEKRLALEEKVNGLNAFIEQSGLLYYKGMMEYIVDSLDSKGIVNKNTLKDEIFTTLH